ncbi:hypothetical protein C8J56DRAFT_784895, partial [Mycena floridula]
MKAWIQREELSKSIELLRKEVRQNKSKSTDKPWTEKHIYVCSRQGSHGKSNYQLKFPDRKRKRSKKWTGCQCRITFRFYPNTPHILAFYNDVHDHAIGNANLMYTRIRPDDRLRIVEMLRMGIEPKRVLREIQGDVHAEKNLKNLQNPDRTSHHRKHITMADIHRILKNIDAETIRLHPDDGRLMLEWVANLQEEGSVLAFKSSSDSVPVGYAMESDVFALCIQTTFQQKCFEEYGPQFAGLDATHNTT